MERYHNKNYDGIVLKIDTGILLTNPDLKKHIDYLLQGLKDCQYSTMLPDHRKNIYELENYGSKKADIKKEKEDLKKDFELQQRRLKLKLDHKILPIEIKSLQMISYTGYACDELIFRGETMCNIRTSRQGLNAKAKMAYSEFVKTCNRIEFMDFLKQNQFHCVESTITPSTQIASSIISTNSNDNIYISIPTDYIHVYSLGKRDSSKTYYSLRKLLYDYTLNELGGYKGYYIENKLKSSPYLCDKHEDDDTEYNVKTYLNNFENIGYQFVMKE